MCPLFELQLNVVPYVFSSVCKVVISFSYFTTTCTQTNLVKVAPIGSGKGLSPLEAAVSAAASNRSSPLPGIQQDTELYVSDDEFN